MVGPTPWSPSFGQKSPPAQGWSQRGQGTYISGLRGGTAGETYLSSSGVWMCKCFTATWMRQSAWRADDTVPDAPRLKEHRSASFRYGMVGRALQMASSFMVAGGAGTRPPAGSGCARCSRGSVPARSGPASPPRCWTLGHEVIHSPSSPHQAAAFPEPEYSSRDWGRWAGGGGASSQAQPPEPARRGSSLPRLLSRRQRLTLKRRRGPRYSPRSFQLAPASI